jgi:erythromycin esterase
MRASNAAVVFLILLGLTSLDAGTDARVAWLKGRLAPLRSIDPADEDFSDLEPIRKAVGDSRIVWLSEPSHGDGATFHARTRLIKFLHQKCGFDLLAFESGLYDCRKAWELLREGKMPARQAVSQGVFDIWTSSKEVQPLIEYLGRQARTPRPLEICGFDCQFSAAASGRYLPGEMTALLDKLPPDSLTADQRAAVLNGCKQLASLVSGMGKEEEQAFAVCRKALDLVKPSDTLPVADLAFWRQFVDSTLALAEVHTARKDKVKTERNHINLRDVQMAKNLVWLAKEAFPKRKIIVWAAAFHLLRNQQTVAMVTEPGKTPAERKTVFPYPQITTMGNEAWRQLAKETYSIFFTAAEGEWQTIRMPTPKKLAPLIPGSLEDLIIKAGGENAFLDLRGRGPEGRWLEERLITRVLGNMDHEAEWTKVCDGLVFTRKQFGATPVGAGGFAARYQPKRESAPPGVPFDRYTTTDRFDRTITFYLSHPPKGGDDKLPVALSIQGSGCASVFSERDGKVYGSLQNLLLAAGKGRVRVLVIEKPGVKFGAVPKKPGAAEEGSAKYRREHVLPRWVEAVNAALKATHRLPGVDWTRTLVVGHSEGGIVAAHLAAANPLATHVAVLAGGGPTQLFDLVELAGQPRPTDKSPADAATRVRAIHDGWARVLADPDNADKLWLGHPHRRWSSFLKTSTLEGLLACRAPVFLAHGTEDKAVPVASFDVARAELTAHGRDVVAERLDGMDHGFRKSDEPPSSFDGFQKLLGRVVAWFLEKQSPVELAVRKDLDRFQGTWQMVSITQGGENKPLEGPLANMRVVVQGDKRSVHSGEMVFSHALYRIDPTARPARIDVTVEQGALRGQTLLGIYEIVGDTQRVCLAQAGAERPRDFVTSAENGKVVQTLKRLK